MVSVGNALLDKSAGLNHIDLERRETSACVHLGKLAVCAKASDSVVCVD